MDGEVLAPDHLLVPNVDHHGGQFLSGSTPVLWIGFDLKQNKKLLRTKLD